MRCFLTGRGRAPGTPAFVAAGLCTWPDVGVTLPLLLTAAGPGAEPCVLGCARPLSSSSRLTPRGAGMGVLVRGGCAGGCVGVGATAGVEGRGVPAESGTTEPWALANFLSSFYKRKKRHQIGRSEMICDPGTHPLLSVFTCLCRLGNEGMNIPLE